MESLPPAGWHRWTVKSVDTCDSRNDSCQDWDQQRDRRSHRSTMVLQLRRRGLAHFRVHSRGLLQSHCRHSAQGIGVITRPSRPRPPAAGRRHGPPRGWVGWPRLMKMSPKVVIPMESSTTRCCLVLLIPHTLTSKDSSPHCWKCHACGQEMWSCQRWQPAREPSRRDSAGCPLHLLHRRCQRLVALDHIQRLRESSLRQMQPSAQLPIERRLPAPAADRSTAPSRLARCRCSWCRRPACLARALDQQPERETQTCQMQPSA